MKMGNRLIGVILLVLMSLSACGQAPVAEPTQPVIATQPVEQPEATEPVEAWTVQPQTARAAGNMVFYLYDRPVYAGGPVSAVLEAGVEVYDDLEAVLQPMHFSGALRILVDGAEDLETERKPWVYFVAVNPTEQPLPISKCLIYSICVSYESGIPFGGDASGTPFVSGVSSKEEILKAYGQPTQQQVSHGMTELAYYSPFDCAYFTFNGDVVEQVITYYGCNLFGGLAQSYDGTLPEDCLGSDCYLLMSRYFDVAPYLTGEQQPALSALLAQQITVNGEEIQLGIPCEELPAPFGENLGRLQVPLEDHYYLRIGIKNEEEFYLINSNGTEGTRANRTRVKGVITRSSSYANWGQDNSGYFPFAYQGITQDSTVEDVLEKFAQPQELICVSDARACYAWLHYKDEGGNTLRIQVDPILNRVTELRIIKYYPGEKSYN